MDEQGEIICALGAIADNLRVLALTMKDIQRSLDGLRADLKQRGADE